MLKRITCVLIVLYALIPLSAHSRTVTAEDFSGAQWIWHPDPGVRAATFQRSISFEQPVEEIDFYVTASEQFELRVNERMIGSSRDYRKPCEYRVPRPIARDASLITIKAGCDAGTPGLLCNMVVRFRDGQSKIIGTDSVWQCAPAAGSSSALNSSFVYAKPLGNFPCTPWGSLFKEKWDSLSDRLFEIRKHKWHPSSPADAPSRSAFKGEYLRPEYDQLFRSCIRLNSETGLLQSENKIVRPLFVLYSQPASGGQVYDVPSFDFDLLRKDFARIKESGMDVEACLNWADLLNKDGDWKVVSKQPHGKKLPEFKYAYEVYDYFLDCAQSNGIHVNFEPSLADGLNTAVIPAEYHGVLPLYDELWDSITNAYAAILGRFSDRAVLVSTVIGRDLRLDDPLTEPATKELFRRYLENKYKSISNLHQSWRYGYNYADRSKWERRSVGDRTVFWPEYPFIRGVYDSIESFDDIQLPGLEYCRSIDPPFAPLYDLPTDQVNITHDPVWLEFTQMRKELLTSRLNEFAEALKSADPSHLVTCVTAHDFSPMWRSNRATDKGDLNCDVVCVDRDSDERQAESYVQTINSCRPYVGNGSAKGIASSKASTPATLLPDFAEIVGGGAAFEICDWAKISSGENASLSAMQNFLSSVQGVPLKIRKDARVLIVRSSAESYSLSPGYDIGNTMRLASLLYRLHIAFDILPDSDMVPGVFGQGTVNMDKYRFIFVPEQNQLLGSSTWQMLYDWISDPRYVGQRGLCVGLYREQDSHFGTIEPSSVHPAFEKLLGVTGYSSRVHANGSVSLQYARFVGAESRGKEISLRIPEGGDLGAFDPAKDGPTSILQIGDHGPSVAIRNMVNGNSIYACGFNLGLCYDPLGGQTKDPDGLSDLAPLYLEMLKSAGIEAEFAGSENLALYMTADMSTILLHENQGVLSDCDVSIKHSSAVCFAGMETLLRSDGVLVIKRLHLEPGGVLMLKKVGEVSLSGGKDLSVTSRSTSDDLECTISGKGRTTAIFDLRPDTSYSVRLNNGEPMLAKVRRDGKYRINLDLGRPARVEIRIKK